MLLEQSERWKQELEKEKEKLSKELLIVLDEFHAKGINYNYAKLLQIQIDTIELRLKDVGTLETASLRKLKMNFKLSSTNTEQRTVVKYMLKQPEDGLAYAWG